MSCRPVQNVSDYLDKVFLLGENSTGIRCYRGEGDTSFEFKPSVMRNLLPDAERQMLRKLFTEIPEDFKNDRTMFEKLTRAQHYKLPTRLLDVSLNPLVALYFACNEKKNHKVDGRVRIIDFLEDRIKFPDSDAVSVICNLAHLSDEDREEIIDIKQKMPKLSRQETKQSFRDAATVKRLMQFVRSEKPYFQDILEPRDLFRYFFVHPAKNNKRILAQSGAFIAAGLLEYTSPENSKGLKMSEFIIPWDKKEPLIDELSQLNINDQSMFPEIEYATQYIKAQHMKPKTS